MDSAKRQITKTTQKVNNFTIGMLKMDGVGKPSMLFYKNISIGIPFLYLVLTSPIRYAYLL